MCPENIRHFFSSKSFTATFKAGAGSYIATVTTPDLRNLECAAGGDWGPWYTMPLPLSSTFELEYRKPDSQEGCTYQVSPATVTVESPMHADVRQEFPFALNFIDAARGLRFRALMNKDGEVARTYVEPIHGACDVPRMLFRESRRATEQAAPALRTA